MTAKKTPAAGTTPAPAAPTKPPGLDPDLLFDFTRETPQAAPAAPTEATTVRTQETRYYARLGPFRYAGKDLGRCELVALKPGARNNDKLIERGFLAVVPEDAQTAVCGECGREFLSERFRVVHGDEVHKSRYVDPDIPVDEEKDLTRTMRQVYAEFPVMGVETARA